MPPKKTLKRNVASKAESKTLPTASSASLEMTKATTTPKTPTTNLSSAQADKIGKIAKHKLNDNAEKPELNGSKRAKVDRAASPSWKKDAARPARKKKTITKLKGPNSKVILTQPPIQPLQVYVFGGNSAGELGLGTQQSPESVARPRLNLNLSAPNAGIIQIATGGMHGAALTSVNEILTWR